MNTPILSFRDVTLTYRASDQPDREVLRGVSFDLPAGKSISLQGRSGSGKSTLLHLAAGISVPTSGSVVLDGRDLGRCSEQDRTLLRRRSVGLVFQFFHLLPHLTVAENVALPGWIAGTKREENESRAADLLARVGLGDRRRDPVGRLSGGEMQRVAICRALLRRPALLLADEPTGALDDRSGQDVMALLLELTQAEGGTLLYVTHSRELAAAADAGWRLVGGRLEQGISP